MAAKKKPAEPKTPLPDVKIEKANEQRARDFLYSIQDTFLKSGGRGFSINEQLDKIGEQWGAEIAHRVYELFKKENAALPDDERIPAFEEDEGAGAVEIIHFIPMRSSPQMYMSVVRSRTGDVRSFTTEEVMEIPPAYRERGDNDSEFLKKVLDIASGVREQTYYYGTHEIPVIIIPHYTPGNPESLDVELRYRLRDGWTYSNHSVSLPADLEQKAKEQITLGRPVHINLSREEIQDMKDNFLALALNKRLEEVLARDLPLPQELSPEKPDEKIEDAHVDVWPERNFVTYKAENGKLTKVYDLPDGMVEVETNIVPPAGMPENEFVEKMLRERAHTEKMLTTRGKPTLKRFDPLHNRFNLQYFEIPDGATKEEIMEALPHLKTFQFTFTAFLPADIRNLLLLSGKDTLRDFSDKDIPSFERAARESLFDTLTLKRVQEEYDKALADAALAAQTPPPPPPPPLDPATIIDPSPFEPPAPIDPPPNIPNTEMGARFRDYEVDLVDGKPVRIVRVKEYGGGNIHRFHSELPLPPDGTSLQDHLTKLDALRDEINRIVIDKKGEIIRSPDGFRLFWVGGAYNIVRIRFHFRDKDRSEADSLDFDKPSELPADIQHAFKRIGKFDSDRIDLSSLTDDEKMKVRPAIVEAIRERIMLRAFSLQVPLEHLEEMPPLEPSEEPARVREIDARRASEVQEERRRRQTENRAARRENTEETPSNPSPDEAGIQAEPILPSTEHPAPSPESTTPQGEPATTHTIAAMAQNTPPPARIVQAPDRTPQHSPIVRVAETPAPRPIDERAVQRLHDARSALSRAEENYATFERGLPFLKFINSAAREKALRELNEARAAYGIARGEVLAPRIEDFLAERNARVDEKVRASSTRDKNIFEKAWGWVSTGYRALSRINPVERIIQPQNRIQKLVVGMFSVRNLISYGLIGVSVAAGVTPAIGVTAWLLNRALAGLGSGIGTYDILTAWKRRKALVGGNLRNLAQEEIQGMQLDAIVEHMAALQLDAEDQKTLLSDNTTYRHLSERWKEMAVPQHADRLENVLNEKLREVDVVVERLRAQSDRDVTVRKGVAIALGLIIGSGTLYKGVHALQGLLGHSTTPAFSGALPPETQKPSIDTTLRPIGRTLSEYHAYEQRWSSPLEKMNSTITSNGKFSLTDFEQIRNMASWHGTPLGDKASVLLDHIQGHSLLTENSISAVSLDSSHANLYSTLQGLTQTHPELFTHHSVDETFANFVHHYGLDHQESIESLKRSFAPNGEMLWISSDGAIVSQQHHLLADYLHHALPEAPETPSPATDFLSHHTLLHDAGFHEVGNAATTGGEHVILQTDVRSSADLQRTLRRVIMDTAQVSSFTGYDSGRIENSVGNLYRLLQGKVVAEFDPSSLKDFVSLRGNTLTITNYTKLAHFVNADLMQHASQVVHADSPAIRYGLHTSPHVWQHMLDNSSANMGHHVKVDFSDVHYGSHEVHHAIATHEAVPPTPPPRPLVVDINRPVVQVTPPPTENVTPVLSKGVTLATNYFHSGKVDLQAIHDHIKDYATALATDIIKGEIDTKKAQKYLWNVLGKYNLIVPHFDDAVMRAAFAKNLPEDVLNKNLQAFFGGVTGDHSFELNYGETSHSFSAPVHKQSLVA